MDSLGPSRFALIALVMISVPVMGAELRPFRLPESQIYPPPSAYPSYGPPPPRDRRRSPPEARDGRGAKPSGSPAFEVDPGWRERFEHKSNEAERLLRDLE